MSKVSKRQMKSAARLYAVQALFQMEASGQTAEKVGREFADYRFGVGYEDGEELIEGDPDLFTRILHQYIQELLILYDEEFYFQYL